MSKTERHATRKRAQRRSKGSQIELNDQFKRALDIMEYTSESVFITGRAGTGKSTLLNYFRNATEKNIAVLAPTGVAALNVKAKLFTHSLDSNPVSPLSESRKFATAMRLAISTRNLMRLSSMKSQW